MSKENNISDLLVKTSDLRAKILKDKGLPLSQLEKEYYNSTAVIGLMFQATIEKLKEAAFMSKRDDVNGYAGEVVEEALKMLGVELGDEND